MRVRVYDMADVYMPRYLYSHQTPVVVVVVVLTLTHRYNGCSPWSQDRLQQLWSGRLPQEETIKKGVDRAQSRK